MSPAASGRFSMSSEAEDLARLRAWLREALEGLGVDRAMRAELVLAVGELCANSIEHAYEGRGGQPINVSVLGHPDRLVAPVLDPCLTGTTDNASGTAGSIRCSNRTHVRE